MYTHDVRVRGHPLNTGAVQLGTRLAVSSIDSIRGFSVGAGLPLSRSKKLCRISNRSPEGREKITMYFHSNTQLLVDALKVLGSSPYHRGMTVEKLERYIISAIKNRRLIIIRNRDEEPIGVFTWAYLSSDREPRYMDDPTCIVASDFESDDGTLWAIDFAAPFGYCREVVRALRKMFPKGTKFRIYRTEQNRYGWMIA